MAKEKLSDYQIYNSARVTVTRQGNIYQILHVSHKNETCNIRNIDADHYQILRTGEIKEKIHWDNRSCGANSLRKTFAELRAIINTNCSEPLKCKWLTLTYRQENGEPMTDTKVLYSDVKKFIMQLRYQCNKFGYGRPEYIIICEPQHNGAWHCHVILIFPHKAPFLACSADTYRMLNIERKKGEKTIEEMWDNGFCQVRNFKSEFGNVDNIGAYVTAYVADLPFDEANQIKNLNLSDYQVKNGRWYNEKENKYVDKLFVKGARLQLYPTNFHLYRTSRGIKKPVEYETDYLSAKKEVSGQTLTYSSDTLINTGDFRFVVSKRQYNSKRESNQAIINGNLVDLDTGDILEENYLDISHREKKFEQQSLFEEEG